MNNVKTFENYLNPHNDEITTIPSDIKQDWLDKYHEYCQENNESPECNTIEELDGDQTLIDHMFYCADDYCKRNRLDLVGREYMDEEDTMEDDFLDNDMPEPIMSFDQQYDVESYTDKYEEDYEEIEEYEEDINTMDCGCEEEESCTHVKNFEAYGYSYEEEIDSDGVEHIKPYDCGCEDEESCTHSRDLDDLDDLDEAYINGELSTKRSEITSKLNKINNLVDDLVSTEKQDGVENVPDESLEEYEEVKLELEGLKNDLNDIYRLFRK